MSFSTLEILAGLMIVLTTIKIIILYIKPEIWMKGVKRMFVSPQVSAWIALLLAGVVLFFLLSAGIRLVDILVVTLFIGLIMMAGLAPFAHDLLTWVNKQDLRMLLNKMWLYTLVWVLLLMGAVVEILT